MTYRIYVTKEIFDVFEDGSRKCVSVSQGWYRNNYYNSMMSSKESLSNAIDALKEDFYDVTEINSVTILGVRKNDYAGERFAPLKQEEKIIYHIEKR